jgi:hypothetical protein
MGLGMLTGNAPSSRYFYRPQDLYVFVFAYHGSTLLICLLGAYWIFLKEGARKISDLPALSVYIRPGKNKPISSVSIKRFWILVLFSIVLSIINMVIIDISV